MLAEWHGRMDGSIPTSSWWSLLGRAVLAVGGAEVLGEHPGVEQLDDGAERDAAGRHVRPRPRLLAPLAPVQGCTILKDLIIAAEL